MFKVFVLILALASQGEGGIATSTRSFDTKEACEAYAPELLKIIENDLKNGGLDSQLTVGTWKCATEAEFNRQKS